MGESGICREVVSGCSGSAVQYTCVSISWFAILATINMDMLLAPTADCEVCGVICLYSIKKVRLMFIVSCVVYTVKILCQGQWSLAGVNYLLKAEQ